MKITATIAHAVTSTVTVDRDELYWLTTNQIGWMDGDTRPFRVTDIHGAEVVVDPSDITEFTITVVR